MNRKVPRGAYEGGLRIFVMEILKAVLADMGVDGNTITIAGEE